MSPSRALVLQWEVLGRHDVKLHFQFNETWGLFSVRGHCDWVCRRFTQTASLKCRHQRSTTRDSDPGVFKWGPCMCVVCGGHSVVSHSLRPHGLQPTGLLCPWNSPSRILGWIAIPFSRGASQPRDRTLVAYIAGIFFTIWAMEKSYISLLNKYSLWSSARGLCIRFGETWLREISIYSSSYPRC